VRTGAELDDVARAMTDYDLTAIPVLDDAEHPIGVITVDDILEMLIPPPGRRFGLFGGS
jgi:Mg/Co/Ni transporter MgtE